MLIDNSLILDNALALTTTGSSTNYIDTIGAAGGQAQISGVNAIQGGYDAYESLWIVAEVIASFATGTGTSLDVTVWSSSTAANIWTTGNGGSIPTVSSTVPTIKVADSGVVAKASLTAGAVLIKQRLPAGMQRFIGAFYTCVGSLSVGTISVMLVPDVDINLT